MAIAAKYSDWREPAQRLDMHQRCSPALLELARTTSSLYGLVSLGCHGKRPVRGGTVPSVHSWGAAVDLSYRSAPGGSADERRRLVIDEVVPWLVAWSEEWGLTAIHDYVGGRIWHAGRTPVEAEACSLWWRAQKPDAYGMGKSWADWLHVEVHPARWADGRTAAARGITL